MSDVELLQFLRSPYNEKARWALAHHGVAHRRRSVLPGPHMLLMPFWTGQAQTPVLRRGKELVIGSGAIVRALDVGAADPLVPRDPALAAEVDALEARFDAGLTPRMRVTVLHALLAEPSAWVAVFAEEESPASQSFYRAMLGVVGRGVRAKYGLRPDAAADGRLAVREALELVATRSRETGYLVGDHFTLADLTAASSLAMIFGAAHPDMTMPPRPAALQSLVDELSAHPGRRWLDTVYERHRRGPAL